MNHGPDHAQWTAPALDIRLLGRFQVFRSEELIPDSAWTRRKARSLFKILVLSPNQRCHKEQLLEFLWPDLAPAAAVNNLHKTLYHLRRTLCPDVADARRCPYIEFDGDTVALASHLIDRVDVWRFQAEATAALASADPDRCTETLALYAGELLPEDLYEDWAIPHREALRQTYLALLRRLGELLGQRDHEAAIAVWQRLLAVEPMDEDAHRALMRAYALAGRRHQALRQYHLCRRVLAEELDIEPMPETVSVYEAILAGEIAPAPVPSLSYPLLAAPYRLVGREAEMTALLTVFDQVAAGTPQLVLIGGEVGVGKTRLAHEVARQASEQGLPVLAGTTYEPVGTPGELPLPYGPLIDALRRFLADQPTEVRRRLIGPWEADLARLLPELGGEPAALEPEAARRRLFDAIAHLLGTVAAARPLLLLLDDFHAVDQATLELVGYLLHRPVPFRVLILALMREEDVQPAPTPLTNLLARAGQRGLLTRLTLSPLSATETAHLVHDRLPGAVDEAVTWAVHQASEGNPLFAEQLLQSWQEEGIIVGEEGHWLLRFQEQPLPLPASLRETINLRLTRLPAAVQEVLALAAIAGREFPYQWLQAAGSWDDLQLLDLLDEALQARVLEETESGSGSLFYRFLHGLIRQTVYEGLSAGRRRRLHWQLAEALEGLPDVSESVLSHHWFAAGHWPRAFRYARTAASQALRAFAHVEAVSLYDRALAAARGGWQVDDDSLADVHAGRAQALMGLNRFGEAVTDLEWLVDRARTTGDRAVEGQALSQLATAYFWDHDLDVARRYAQEALDIAQETGDAVTATMCTSNLGCIALCTGHLAQGARHLEAVLQRGRALGRPGLLVEALACLPGAYHWQGDSARALPLLEEGIAIARREGLGFWLGNLLFFAGLAHGALGHYGQALDYFRQGQRHSQEVGDMFTAVRVANCLGWIHYELHDPARAITYDRRSAEMAQGFPWPEPLANALVNLGFDYLRVGEETQAERCFAEAADLLEKDEWMRWRWHTRLLLGWGRLSLIRGDLDRAETYARQALALAEETAARKNQARAHLLLGEIAQAAGEVARAMPLLQQAATLAQMVDNPCLRWQSLNALAQVMWAADEGQIAIETWRRAAQVIRAIAAGLPEGELRAAFLSAEAVRAVLRRDTER